MLPHHLPVNHHQPPSSSASTSSISAPTSFSASLHMTHDNTSTDLHNTANASDAQHASSSSRRNKPNVQRACVNCRRAHLACDAERPCRRCVSVGKEDGCYDVDHKKRGRPKLRPNRPMPGAPLRQSSFALTSVPSPRATVSQPVSVVTAFLSMEVCCARVSDEIQNLLGYYPQELAHRSLYAFISSRSSDTLARLHRLLLDNVTRIAQQVDPSYQRSHMPPTERTTSDAFFSTHPDTLAMIANGSQTVVDTIWVKRNDGSSETLMQAQFYLGGGLGADLYAPDTLRHLYIVCLLSKAQQVVTRQPEVRNAVPVTSSNASDGLSMVTSSSAHRSAGAPIRTAAVALWSSQSPSHSSSSTDDLLAPLPDALDAAMEHTTSSEHPQRQPEEPQQHHHHQQQPEQPEQQQQQQQPDLPHHDTEQHEEKDHQDDVTPTPILLTHPSTSANPPRPVFHGRHPWSETFHVAPKTSTTEEKDTKLMDYYVRQAVGPMRLFPSENSPLFSSRPAPPTTSTRSTQQPGNSFMSVDALLS